MTGTAHDALVLDARLRQSLVTVRSLGRRGLVVSALESGVRVPAFSSRWCRGAFVCPAEEATDAYLTYLEQVLASTGARVLIPSADGTTALLRRYRTRLERRARVALAQDAAVAIAVDKEQTLAVARRLGMRVPRGLVVSAEGDLAAALRDIGLPAVVKPSESWVWREGSGGVRLVPELVTTVAAAHRAVAERTRSGRAVLVQQFIPPGRRESVNMLYARGEIYARFAQWARRMSPHWGGESILRQSIPVPPDIGGQAERLVREIHLEGYSEVEFLRDRSGTPYLMEINPRLSASVEIAVRSGIDFPYLLWQWASGRPVDRIQNYRVGGWMRYLAGDLMTTIAALRQRGRPGVAPPGQALLGFGLSFLRPMGYDGADWTDPLPAVQAAADFARHSAVALRAMVSARARDAETLKLPSRRKSLS